MTQAKKGGQVGVNGEFYKGGQYLPNNPNRAKGQQKPILKNRRKTEVEPFVWLKLQSNESALYRYIGTSAYLVDGKMEIFEPYFSGLIKQFGSYDETEYKRVLKACVLYNRGYRVQRTLSDHEYEVLTLSEI